MKSKKVLIEEKDLVRALKERKAIGIRAIYDLYSGALLGVISSIVKQPELAEDILQETFVKIWSSAESYDESKGRLFTWMLNVARNNSINVLRLKSYSNDERCVKIEENINVNDSNIRVTCNPDSIGIRELIYTLKPEYKILLNMIYFKGYTYIETASALRIPVGTVKIGVRSAIMQLRTSCI